MSLVACEPESQPQPAEAATLAAVERVGGRTRSARRIAFVGHQGYPQDPRLRRQAEVLVGDGWEVDVFCLTFPGQPRTEALNGVNVRRLPVTRHRGSGIPVYLLEYALFAIIVTWVLFASHLRRRYQVVQVHTPPDPLVFVTLPERLLGATIVLDLSDLMPDLYASKFGLPATHRTIRTLRTIERICTRYAHIVLAASGPFAERIAANGTPADKIVTVLNTPEPEIFHPIETPEPHERFRVFYHGSLFYRYGLDLAIEALALVARTEPDIEFHIYGEGEYQEELERLVSELGLESIVRFFHVVEARRLPALIAQADVGVCPNRVDVHTDIAFPTKVFEYVAMGVPVVATRTRVLESRFGEDSIRYCDATAESLAEGILWVRRSEDDARRLAECAMQDYEPIRWDRASQEYRTRILAASRRAESVTE